MRSGARVAALAALVATLSGCATLGAAIQPPSFAVDGAQQPTLRLLAPGPGRPAGGAAVRLYARVGNPNPVGITLSTLTGALQLEGREAAQVSFPLGIPLQAGQETVVPLDVAISFDDLPGIANVLQSALTGRPVAYRLNGTIGVDAGLLGQPTFGPSTWLSGSLRVTR